MPGGDCIAAAMPPLVSLGLEPIKFDRCVLVRNALAEVGAVKVVSASAPDRHEVAVVTLLSSVDPSARRTNRTLLPKATAFAAR